MAEFLGENVDELGEDGNKNMERINVLVKQLMELKEEIKKYKKHRNYWESKSSALSTSIWVKQVTCGELQKKEANIRKTISKAMEIADLKKQELRNLRVKRREYSSEQCDNFRTRRANYTDKFLDAQAQYSTENLSRDIEQYQLECNKIQDELQTLTKELKSLETRRDFNCLNSDGDTEDILKINTLYGDVMTNNNNILQEVTSAKNTLKKLENEIKQKKMTRNNCHK